MITERVEGWAAGLRLAALSLDGHPDPGVFIKNLAAEDNALTSYLVDEVLDAQPASGRDLMLRTSILDRVSEELAWKLSGDEHAGRTLETLARSGAFVQPLGDGWYRYHPLFAEVLRLKLRRESPDLMPGLHRQAAGWYQRNGPLENAVAHAAAAGDWHLAARIVVDELAVGDLLQLVGSSPVADILRRIPIPRALPDGSRSRRPCWRPPRWNCVMAVTTQPAACSPRRMNSSAGFPRSRIPSRLAAAMIRLAAARRSGTSAPPGPPPSRRRPCSSSFRPACRAATRKLRCMYSLAAASSNSGPAIWASGRGLRPCGGGHPGRQPGAGGLPRSPRPDRGTARPAEPRRRAGHGRDQSACGLPAVRRLPAAVALALVHLERNELDAPQPAESRRRPASSS